MVKVVRTLMTLRGVTQAELSRGAGISMTALSRYLNEATELRGESLVSVLKALGADVDTLVKREINKALGNEDEGSIGEDVKVLLQNLDPISRRTILDTLISSSQKNQKPEMKNAVSRIKRYRNSIQTVRRMSC